MKAIRLVALEKLEILDVAQPTIANPDDVLLRIKSVGICGSDVHYYKTGRIGSQVVRYPFTLGHECSGIVEDTGTEVMRVATGDKVAVDPAMTCGKCDQCLMDRENTCRNLRFLGCPGQAEGAFSEYLVMPEACLCKVSDSISFEEAVLTEPLCIGSYSVRMSEQEANQNIAIPGVGPIGLSVLIFSRMRNPGKILATDLIDERLDVAKKIGADYIFNPQKENVCGRAEIICHDGIDIVFECAGKQETLDQGVEMLRPGGKLIIIGISELDRVHFISERIRRKELTLINIRRQRRELPGVVKGISEGKIRLNDFITHKFNPEEATKAFEVVANYRDGVIKAFISF